MIIARLALRACRFLERNGRKKICENITGPIPVYSGNEVMRKPTSIPAH